jgi:hypothetical protein
VPVPSPAVLVIAGGVGIAVTTALEAVTAPYSPAVSAYPLNGVVHVAKVLAAVALVVGGMALARSLRRRGERTAAAAAGVVAVATLLGAVPYSVVEALLSPSLTPAAAEAQLEATYERHAWIGTVSSIAIPLVLLGIVTLAVMALRHRLVPAWAPIASLVAVPLAVLAGVLGGLGWAVPHPPAWLFLGLSAYGFALLHRPVPTGALPARLTSTRS